MENIIAPLNKDLLLKELTKERFCRTTNNGTNEIRTRERDGALVVTGENITTEVIKAPPLSDGAVRLRIQQVEADSAQILLVWHSFYRKNFKTRIQEDKKINTAKFFTDLAMRLETLGLTVR